MEKNEYQLWACAKILQEDACCQLGSLWLSQDGAMLRGMNYVGNHTMGTKGDGGICAKVTAWAYVYVHICLLCVYKQRYLSTYIQISNNQSAFCESIMILLKPVHEVLLFALPYLT